MQDSGQGILASPPQAAKDQVLLPEQVSVVVVPSRADVAAASSAQGQDVRRQPVAFSRRTPASP